MTEFEFMRQAFDSLRAAQRLDEIIKAKSEHVVSKPASAMVENIIHNYLELRKTQ